MSRIRNVHMSLLLLLLLLFILSISSHWFNGLYNLFSHQGQHRILVYYQPIYFLLNSSSSLYFKSSSSAIALPFLLFSNTTFSSASSATALCRPPLPTGGSWIYWNQYMWAKLTIYTIMARATTLKISFSCEMQLYKRLCPSVRPSVRGSVGLSSHGSKKTHIQANSSKSKEIKKKS